VRKARVNCSSLADWRARMPAQMIWIAFGYACRLACGPRLSPEAMLTLFVLRPLFADRFKLLPNRFSPSPPKRFAQLVGGMFAAGGTVVRFVLPYQLAWISYCVWAALVIAAGIAGFLGM